MNVPLDVTAHPKAVVCEPHAAQTIRLLVVDDSSMDRELYRRHFESLASVEYVIQEVDLGRAGLEKCHQQKPDCLLLDFRLPDMDGIEFLHELWADFGEDAVPIVMLTGQGSEQIAVEAMKSGVHDYLVKDQITPPALSRAVANAIEKVSLKQEIERQQIELHRLASVDELTGALVRRRFFEEFDRELSLSARHEFPLSVAIIDLDYFKRINDQYGHLAGDEVLRRIGALLRETLRFSDLLGRYGGEEFVVALPNTDTKGALCLLERLRKRVQQEVLASERGDLIRCTFSAGIAERSWACGTTAELIRKADEALYQAKSNGRNRIVVHNSQGTPCR